MVATFEHYSNFSTAMLSLPLPFYHFEDIKSKHSLHTCCDNDGDIKRPSILVASNARYI